MVLYLGGMEVIAGRSLTGGELIAFVVLFYQLFRHLRMLLTRCTTFKRKCFRRRVFEVLDMEEALMDLLRQSKSNGKRYYLSWGPICLRRAPYHQRTRSYYSAGKTTALVGLRDLENHLLHLWPVCTPQQGAISGKTQSAGCRAQGLSKKFRLVPQQPLLFNTSFAGNVALGSTPDLSN